MMSDLHAPAHARHTISALPCQLQPGDTLRDHGVDRTVDYTISSVTVLADQVVVYFRPYPGRPDLPDTLSVPADVTVTARRPDAAPTQTAAL